MKNILLIIENSLEFDLTRTVLFRLGFNILSLQKGADMHTRLQENVPDLVITSVLGADDEILQAFIDVRAKHGTPKFLWVGPVYKVKALNDTQKQLIDDTMSTPIQPEVLITKVCDLLALPSQKMIDAYHKLLSGSFKLPEQPKSKLIHDPARAEKYAAIARKIEKYNRVFKSETLDKFTTPEGAGGNTEDLLNKKQQFVKTIFKK